MKNSKTNRHLIHYNQVSTFYLEKHKDAENKVCLAIKKFVKQLTPIFEEYNDSRDDIQLDNCAVDEKTKVVLKGAEGERNRISKISRSAGRKGNIRNI